MTHYMSCQGCFKFGRVNVTNIAGVNSNQAVYKANHNPMFPSFNKEEETCRHVLGCDEEGRVKALNCTIDLMYN